MLLDMFNDKQVFLLNGPPSSGKDTLAKYVSGLLVGFKHDSMAFPLKQANKGFFGMTEAEYQYYDSDPIAKNTKCDRFYGKSWREANIKLSENFLKNEYGVNIFGKLLLKRIQDSTEHKGFLISDSGFTAEAEPIIEALGKENVHHIIIKRNGCDYSIDSRGYLDLKPFGVHPHILENNGDKQDFEFRGLELIQKLYLRHNK